MEMHRSRPVGMISAVIALVILPWNLYDNPAVINYFLGALGAFLGSLFGIVMADYYVLRQQQVDVADLSREDGRYAYTRGWSRKALVSFAASAVPTATIASVPGFRYWAPFSWFIGAGLSATVHCALSRHDVASRVAPTFAARRA